MIPKCINVENFEKFIFFISDKAEIMILARNF